MTTKMNSKKLKALSIVCLHTTLPVISKQEKEIIDLRRRLRNANDTIDNLYELREFCESYGYDEDFDRDRMENGEEPLLNSREYYAE